MSRADYAELKYYRLAMSIFYRRFRFFINREKTEAEAIAALAAWEAEAVGASGRTVLNIIQKRIRVEIANFGCRFDNDTGKYGNPYCFLSEPLMDAMNLTFAEQLARAWAARLVLQTEKRRENPNFFAVPCAACQSKLHRHKAEVSRNKTQKFYCNSRCQAQVQKFQTTEAA